MQVNHICNSSCTNHRRHCAYACLIRLKFLVMLPHRGITSQSTFLQSSGPQRMPDFTYLDAGLIQYLAKVSSNRAYRCSLMNCCHIDHLAVVCNRGSQSIVSCLILHLTSVRRKLVFYWAESRGAKSLPMLVPCFQFCWLSATLESAEVWLDERQKQQTKVRCIIIQDVLYGL